MKLSPERDESVFSGPSVRLPGSQAVNHRHDQKKPPRLCDFTNLLLSLCPNCMD
jgi:hypothetical protein